MLEYIRFSTQTRRNKSVIEIRVEEEQRLEATIEGVSYPLFECFYSLTAENGEEWLGRMEQLHMENWRGIYMEQGIRDMEDTETWEVYYRTDEGIERKVVGKGAYPENWKEFLQIMDEIIPTAIPGQINTFTLEYRRNVPLQENHSQNGETVLWEYKEEMILDRRKETLTIRQIISPEREITKEYYMKAEIPKLLDDCLECIGENDEAAMYREEQDGLEENTREPVYRIYLEGNGGEGRTFAGRYNRAGLPEGWDELIQKISQYIQFYESREDILNPYIYGRGRRPGEYILCKVTFHPGGRKYRYRTEDETLSIGDEVIVLAGPYDQEIPARIESVKYYKADELPVPLEELKYILRRRDD